MTRPWTVLAVGLLLASSGVTGAAGPDVEGRSGPREKIIRGIVVDQAGRPVAGAKVWSALPYESARPTSTVADGTFRLNMGTPDGLREYLNAKSEGGELVGQATFEEPFTTDPPEPVRIVVKPGRSVTVRVRDADGRAVAGATVELLYLFRDSATTDANGRATFRFPTEINGTTIIGLKSGVGFDHVKTLYTAEDHKLPAPPTDVTLTLDGARTLRIKAVGTLGLPVAGVGFRPWRVQKPGKKEPANLSFSEIAVVRADGLGVATLDWLPPVLDRHASILIASESYSCPKWPVYRSAVAPAELETRLLRKTMIRGAARRADGTPAANVLLQIEGHGAASLYCRKYMRTAQDGSYSIVVDSEQSYMIAVLDDRWAAQTLTGVIVHEGQPWEALDLKLIAGTLIHGRITVGPEDKPPVRSGITLIEHGQPLPPEFIKPRGRTEQSIPRWAHTDADGRYQVRVGPGRYQLWSPGAVQKEELTIGTEAEIVRDFHRAGP